MRDERGGRAGGYIWVEMQKHLRTMLKVMS